MLLKYGSGYKPLHPFQGDSSKGQVFLKLETWDKLFFHIWVFNPFWPELLFMKLVKGRRYHQYDCTSMFNTWPIWQIRLELQSWKTRLIYCTESSDRNLKQNYQCPWSKMIKTRPQSNGKTFLYSHKSKDVGSYCRILALGRTGWQLFTVRSTVNHTSLLRLFPSVKYCT